jgi:hypothetical protein
MRIFLAEADSLEQSSSELANQTDVEIACQIAYLADDAVRDNCTMLCAESECCFAVDGKNASCADYLQFCSEFEVCRVIFDPPNATEIVESCDPDLINGTNGRELCMSLCTVGSCCWDDLEKVSSCANNTDFCTDYEPCFALLGDNTTMPDTVGLDVDGVVGNTTIAQACDANFTLGNASCIEQCAIGACCFVEPMDKDFLCG